MILTCPQCSTRFLLPASDLAPDGKKVKCSECEEIWFQEPDADELDPLAGVQEGTAQNAEGEDENENEIKQDEEDPLAVKKFAEHMDDDIPEGVKPAPDNDPEDGQTDKLLREKPSAKAVKKAYLAVALIFILSLYSLYAARNMLISAWPPAAAIYNLAGIEADISNATDGLVFDRTRAIIEQNSEGQNILVVSGALINLTSKDILAPVINVSYEDTETAPALWIIEPSTKIIKAEKTLTFKSEAIIKDTVPSNIKLMLGVPR